MAVALNNENQEEKRMFRTEDLTLASLLHYEGYSPVEMVRDGDGCVWLFDFSYADGEDRNPAMEVIEDYSDGHAEVEPKEFVKSLALTRKKMYRFLGVPERRVRD